MMIYDHYRVSDGCIKKKGRDREDGDEESGNKDDEQERTYLMTMIISSL